MSVISKLFFFGILGSILSCKTNQLINNKREGKWIESYSLDSSQVDLHFKSKGNYLNDLQVKTWRHYKNKKLIKKGKYKQDFCEVTFYLSNGRIEKKGKTRTQISDKEAQWFYRGPWKIFNSKGKLKYIIHYEYGIPFKTDSIFSKTK
jgi:hypothetical protein